MKIVVTGALGHIGSRFMRDAAGYFPGVSMVLVDNLATLRFPSLFNLPETARYRFVEGDVTTMDLEPIIQGADAVLHLAAITDAAGSFERREQVERVNFQATTKVAEACVRNGAPMIHLSSTSVYGTQANLVDEDCTLEELKPQSPYAETKLREEAYLMEQSSSSGLKFIVCRFGTICGISPGMRFHTAVNKFCWQAIMETPLTVWRTALHQKRPYLTLDDASRAVAFIIRKHLFDGRIYNVLTENRTVNDIVEAIRTHIADVRVELVDAQIMNQLSYEVSCQRFLATGYRFEGSVNRSIAETIELLKAAGTRGI